MKNDSIDRDALVEETKRLCWRYIREIVLPFSLCPWAAPALQNGAVQMSVIPEEFSHPSDWPLAAARVREQLDRIDDDAIELVLILLPLCHCSRLDMDELLRHVRGDEGSHDVKRGETSFALAAFHPDASPDTTSPERFIPYLRRTPDPMIQAVRTSILKKIEAPRSTGTAYLDLETMSLEELQGPTPESLRLKIARTNLETCRDAGLDTIEERYASILDDRRRTRERLGGRNL